MGLLGMLLALGTLERYPKSCLCLQGCSPQRVEVAAHIFACVNSVG